MKKKTASRLWGAWVIAGCAFEAWTFAKGEPGSTLSANFWDLTHIQRRDAWHEKLGKAITIGFITWLPVHWVSGGKI